MGRMKNATVKMVQGNTEWKRMVKVIKTVKKTINL
jgi:hypothetical protein